MSTTQAASAAFRPQLKEPRRRSSLAARLQLRLQQLRAQSSPPTSLPARLVPADLNRVQLSGRLDREPLLFDVGDHHVAALHLVCERSWMARSGATERVQDAFRLTAWEELADSCGRLLHAGDRVFVEGRLRLYSSWLGGVEHTAHEILLNRIVLLARAAWHQRDKDPSTGCSNPRCLEPST